MAKTLSEFYGANLPSIAERGQTFQEFGLGEASGYRGTYGQNVQLLGALQAPAAPTAQPAAPAIPAPALPEPPPQAQPAQPQQQVQPQPTRQAPQAAPRPTDAGIAISKKIEPISAPTERLPDYQLGRDQEGMFQQLKTGQLLAHPDIPEWNQMYEGGKATAEQRQAWQRWMDWKGYTELTGDELTTSLEAGRLSIGSQVWNDLMAGGELTQAQQYAMTKFGENRTIDGINQSSEFIHGVLRKGYDGASNLKSLQAKKETLETDIAAVGQGPSAVDLYKDLVVDNPDLQDLFGKSAELQREIDRLDIQTLYLADEVRELVDGEADSGYIASYAAKKAQPLHKKRTMLLIEQKMINSQLQFQQEMQQNLVQFTLQDDERRYQRLNDQLKFKLSEIDSEYGRQQQAFQNDLEVKKLAYTLPTGKRITLNDGTVIEGQGEKANLQLTSFTESDGKTYMIAYDKNTGQEVRREFMGSVAVKATGGRGGGGGGGGAGAGAGVPTADYYKQVEQGLISGTLTEYGDEIYSTGELQLAQKRLKIAQGAADRLNAEAAQKRAAVEDGGTIKLGEPSKALRKTVGSSLRTNVSSGVPWYEAELVLPKRVYTGYNIVKNPKIK